MNSSNGISPNKGVPQEGRTTIPDGSFEEKTTSRKLSECGVGENEGGAERDASRKEAIEKGKGVGLLGLAKRLGAGDEWKEIGVRLSRRDCRDRVC